MRRRFHIAVAIPVSVLIRRVAPPGGNFGDDVGRIALKRVIKRTHDLILFCIPGYKLMHPHNRQPSRFMPNAKRDGSRFCFAVGHMRALIPSSPHHAVRAHQPAIQP
jgi:hypothetical protein